MFNILLNHSVVYNNKEFYDFFKSIPIPEEVKWEFLFDLTADQLSAGVHLLHGVLSSRYRSPSFEQASDWVRRLVQPYGNKIYYTWELQVKKDGFHLHYVVNLSNAVQSPEWLDENETEHVELLYKLMEPISEKLNPCGQHFFHSAD